MLSPTHNLNNAIDLQDSPSRNLISSRARSGASRSELRRTERGQDAAWCELAPNRRTAIPTSSLSATAAARRLIEGLVARGVDTFFGIPGGPVCPVFEAIRLTPGAHLVASRQETHAALAAALFFRASGRVPAVVVTAGPGATNAVTGIASASLERIPMLVIVGDVAWATTGHRLAQDSGPEGISIESMLAPVTRAQVRAAHSRSVVGQALAALEFACNPILPGPALFVLPIDHAIGECDATDMPPRTTRWSAAPSSEAVKRTIALLCEARRPLIVLGAGCRGHETAVRALVDACHIPFVTTPRAKGLVSERHPRSLRNGGLAASMWARRYTAEPVDVCLALGTDLDDTSIGPTRYVGERGKLVHVDLDARVFGRNVPTTLGVNADLGLFTSALCDEIGSTGLVNGGARLALGHARSVSPFDLPESSSESEHRLHPQRLLADLEAAVGPRARFVTDIGEHMLFALHYLTAGAPDAFYIQLNLGSMGSGIAGAIGLALADRARRVVCLAGDGCMHMSGMEALVAIREQLPILFVVFNDGRYNMVHHGMRQIFGEAAEYESPPVDFAAWARAIGMPSAVISRPGELTCALADSLLASGGPGLVDARIDAQQRVRGGGRVEALQHMSMLTARTQPTRPTGETEES
jgi:acetolactate synthase-1/2/3 large subunit